MNKQQLRTRVAGSRVAPLAALPTRARMVMRHDLGVLRDSGRWLLHSREHTNLTYDLTPVSRDHLAWFVSAVASVPVAQARGYLDEIEADKDLRSHIQTLTTASRFRRIADPVVRYGRRMGWYALVRACRPEHVVETGTDKGLGAVVMGAALLRNGTGRLTTIDVNPRAGYLIQPPYRDVVEVRTGETLSILPDLREVGLFLHDSSPPLENKELAAVAGHLTANAVVLSNRSRENSVLARWAEQREWRFHYFAEQVANHWYPGAGIGAAIMVQAGPGKTA